jgi:hypothetical protein
MIRTPESRSSMLPTRIVATLDAYSLRLDHRLHDKLSLFGRYSYSPSSSVARATAAETSARSVPAKITTQSATGWWNVVALPHHIRWTCDSTSARRSAGALPIWMGLEEPFLLNALPFPAASQTAIASFSLHFPASCSGCARPTGRQRAEADQFGRHGFDANEAATRSSWAATFRRLSANLRHSGLCTETYFKMLLRPLQATQLPNACVLWPERGLAPSQSWALCAGHVAGNQKSDANLRGPLGSRRGSFVRSIPLPAVTGLQSPGSFSSGSWPHPERHLSRQLTATLRLAWCRIPVSPSQNWPTCLAAEGSGASSTTWRLPEVGNAVQIGVYPFGATNYLLGRSFPR